MYHVGIFSDGNDNFYWMDCTDECDMSKAEFYLDADNFAGVHICVGSAYDNECKPDYSDSYDGLQNEMTLADGELYIVTYFKFIEEDWSLDNPVDFGLTKQEIIENVKNKRYAEGATYYTIGQMFYVTKRCLYA